MYSACQANHSIQEHPSVSNIRISYRETLAHKAFPMGKTGGSGICSALGFLSTHWSGFQYAAVFKLTRGGRRKWKTLRWHDVLMKTALQKPYMVQSMYLELGSWTWKKSLMSTATGENNNWYSRYARMRERERDNCFTLWYTSYTCRLYPQREEKRWVSSDRYAKNHILLCRCNAILTCWRGQTRKRSYNMLEHGQLCLCAF